MSDEPFLVFMDFDDDGILEKPDNDLTPYLAGEQPLIWSRGKNQNKRFAPAQAGIADGAVENITRRFSPWNTESDLAGKLDPGHLMQIKTRPSTGKGLAFADGTGFAFADGTGVAFAGVPGRTVGTYISEGFPQPARWFGAQARIPGIGPLSRLVDTDITLPLQQDITTSAAIHLALDKIEWPEDKRDIDEGLAIIKWFAPDGEDGFQLVARIVQTEGPGATWGEDGEGNFIFRNRDSLTTNPRSTMVQKELSDLDWHIQDLSFEQNYRDIIKAARVQIDEKEPGPIQEFWTHGGDLVLGPNEEIRIDARGSGIVFNAQTPTDVASNTIWKFEGDRELTSGNFKGEYLGQITAGTLAHNATASDFQAQFGPLSTIGTANIEFSGGPLNVAPIFGQLKGVFAGLPITTTPTIIESTLNPVPIPGGISVEEIQSGGGGFQEHQRLKASGTLVSGTWHMIITFVLGTFETDPLAFDALADDIAAVFADIVGLEATSAIRGPINEDAVDVHFEDITSENIENVIIVPDEDDPLMMAAPSATVKVTISQPGGIPDWIATAGSLDEILLEETSGAVIPLFMRAGPDGVTLAGLRLRGQLLVIVRSQEITHPPDTMLPPSKVHRPDILSDISAADARLIVEGWVSFYGTHRPSGIATNETSTDDPEGMDAIFQLREADMIKLINHHSGLGHKAHIRKFDFVHDPNQFLLITKMGWELAE